jgi:hypothetical protein
VRLTTAPSATWAPPPAPAHRTDVRVRTARLRVGGWRAAWLALGAAAVAVLCCVDVLPLYDYYLWLFQGHVVGALLFGADPGATVVGRAYALSAVPVPNLAAPLAIGLLDTVLPVETAGRVVVILTVLGFAAAFGFLVRTLQRRRTWVELTGFVWALGFFLEKGYLSYLIGLALAFVLVAVLDRTVVHDHPPRRTYWLLGALGVAVYLAHLIAWSIGALAAVVHVLVLVRRAPVPRAALGTATRLLAATLAPGLALLGWYTVAEHGGSGVAFYTTLSSKAISLVEPLLAFLRLDPFPPAFPVFWVDLAVVLVVGTLVVREARWADVRAAVAQRPVLWCSGALAVVALLLPIAELNELIKPDERFVLPAVLLALAALPWRPLRPSSATAVVGLVAAVIGLHAVEFTAVADRVNPLDTATDAFVPAGSRVLELAVASRHGCTPASGVTIGVPTLKWFGVDHVLETGGAAVVALDETSIVHARADAGPPALTTLTPTSAAEATDLAVTAAPDTGSVLLVACADDLDAVTHGVASVYAPVARGDGFALLSRRAA